MNAIRPHLKTLLITLGVLVVGYLLLRRPARGKSRNREKNEINEQLYEGCA